MTAFLFPFFMYLGSRADGKGGRADEKGGRGDEKGGRADEKGGRGDEGRGDYQERAAADSGDETES